jgi:para-nitrobenzyl esterase
VLRTKIQSFWTNLARSGNPVGKSTGPWNAISKTSQPVKGLYPAADPSTHGFLADHRCPFWKPILLGQAGLPSDSAY